MSAEEQNGSGSWQNTDFIFLKKVNKYKKKERERGKGPVAAHSYNPQNPHIPPQTLKTLVFRTLFLTISKFPSICWLCLCSGNVKVTFYTWAALWHLGDQRYPPKLLLCCHNNPSVSRHLQTSSVVRTSPCPQPRTEGEPHRQTSKWLTGGVLAPAK